MSKLIRNPLVKKAALTAVGLPQLRKLKKSSRNYLSTQQQFLSTMLDSTRFTAFGKEHGFENVRTYDDFKKAVPIRDFEGHRPYVDRMCRGEENVLFPGKALFYNTTSGSTDKPKLIPVSREYFENVYSNISRLWLYSCLTDNRRLFHGKNLSAVGPAVEGYVEDGTPFGSISGVTYRNIPGILKDVYATPYPIICMSNYQKKYYAMLRCGLSTPITYIITANPSTLLQFNRVVRENLNDLIRDIHDGTFRKDVLAEIEPAYRDEVLAQFPPNKTRARWLENCAEKYGENIRPRHYWPELECVNTWKQGNSRLILPKLNGWFPEQTSVREFGYMASEARAGLTLENHWEYSVLMAHLYLFEFIEEEKRNDKNPEILLPHELEIGKRYYIFITNGSGLFRYDINDIIRVTGYYNQFPLFEFVQKGEGITSLTGEKLSEFQVIQAVQEASGSSDIGVENYSMFCDSQHFMYKLYIEFTQQLSAAKKNDFLRLVDEQLKMINHEYRAKRDSNRLSAPVIRELKPNSYELIKLRLLAEGKVREGQYKISCLINDPHLQQVYESSVVNWVNSHSLKENCSTL
ncbi:MAG: GH3 auxin-responsive promoter family protein [Chitinispirillaceae bacterium]